VEGTGPAVAEPSSVSSRRTVWLVLLGVVGGLLAINPAHAKASARWLAGAAAEKITPLPFDAARDLQEFPDTTCPRAIFNGARAFDFEEPYADLDGDGTFSYTADLPCDANLNGRWDGLYSSGGVDHLTEWVHDDIWARAVAISDGRHTIVIESVTSQGLFIEDDDRIRQAIRTSRPQVTQVYVSSTHNESSPDPIGIYGAPDPGTGAVGLRSGVDDYYIDFLVAQAVKAGQKAVDAMTPARIRIAEFHPADVRARLSNTFPTTDAIKGGTPPFGTPEATDAKARVLQLVRTDNGANIETILNFAAHNQELGHAPDSSLAANGLRVNRAVSDDWPGVFARAVEQQIGGHAMFMVADNGSIEDPHPNPLVQDCPQIHSDEGCFELPAHTGALLADDVVGWLSDAETIAPHAIDARIDRFYVPLQNQLFIAAFAGGLFAHRTLATAAPCVDAMSIPRTCLLTEVGFVDFGSQLQMLVNPGEAYPALIEGHPFGVEEMACPGRAEPPVPAWHARAKHKLEMGLGNDMIGYEIPSPAWFSDPAVVIDPTCPPSAQLLDDPTADYDQHNQYHKLESESAGPDAGNLVAQNLTALADGFGGPATVIRYGRFLTSDGHFTRKGADGPVGMWLVPPGATAFAPGSGIIVALPGIHAFGTTPVTYHGVFIDFDGRPQSAADIDTRGMLVSGPHGTVTWYFMDPYAQLGGSSPGAAR
jgi:hypothetical protein